MDLVNDNVNLTHENDKLLNDDYNNSIAVDLNNCNDDLKLFDENPQLKDSSNKLNSSIDFNDSISVYGQSIKVNVDSENAIGIDAKVFNENDEVIITDVNINDNSVTINNLAAGSYVLELTTIVDSDYLSVSKNKTMTVNKALSAIDIPNSVYSVYSEIIDISVLSTNVTGLQSVIYDSKGNKINDVEFVVNGVSSVSVSGLTAGSYVLNVIGVVDSNHSVSYG